MVAELDDLRVSCRSQLRPLLEMVKSKKLILRGDDWISFVKRTERNIINSPDQYLSTPTKGENLEIAIRQVFDEFLSEQKTN